MSTLDLDGIIDVLIDIMDEHDFNKDDCFASLDGFVQGYFDGFNGTQFYIQELSNSDYGPAACFGFKENRYPTYQSGTHIYDEEHGWDEDELRDAVYEVLEGIGY